MKVTNEECKQPICDKCQIEMVEISKSDKAKFYACPICDSNFGKSGGQERTEKQLKKSGEA